MTRKKFVLFSGSLLVLLVGVAGIVYWSLTRVPGFYRRALQDASDPEMRRREAKRFVQRSLRLVEKMQNQDAWSEEFTQQQINGWLAEKLSENSARLLPPDFEEPRIRLDNGALHVGCRVQRDEWEGVVSLRVRPWVPRGNQLAFEIQSVKAGLLPIPLDRVLRELPRRSEADDWHMEWHRLNGNDVLIVHLDSLNREEHVLEAVQLTDGAVRLAGRRRSAEGEAVRLSDRDGQPAL